MATCPECHSFSISGGLCARDKATLLEDSEARRRGIEPRIADRYIVHSLLGEGGMGSVYLAQHESLQRKVAIKILRQDVQEEHSSARFKREAKAASLINHRHVVSILDYGELPDGSAYYVMEHLEGKSLADAIDKEGPFPLERVLSVVVQISKGLKAAHEKGVVHRDLKPDNVFLLENQEFPDFVKILDFGVAKVNADNQRITRTGMVLGTPDYMAPEQAIGKPTDHRVDIYALGVLTYELITGQLPFQGQTFVEVLSQHIHNPPPSLREHHPELQVPEELDAFIQKAMKKRPENRFQSMEEVLDALYAIPEADQLLPPHLLPGSSLSRMMPALSESQGAPMASRRMSAIPEPALSRRVSAVSEAQGANRMPALPMPSSVVGRSSAFRAQDQSGLLPRFATGQGAQGGVSRRAKALSPAPQVDYPQAPPARPSRDEIYNSLEETHILEDADESTVILGGDGGWPAATLPQEGSLRPFQRGAPSGPESFAVLPPSDDEAESTETNVFIPSSSEEGSAQRPPRDAIQTFHEGRSPEHQTLEEDDADRVATAPRGHQRAVEKTAPKMASVSEPASLLSEKEQGEEAASRREEAPVPPAIDLSRIEAAPVSPPATKGSSYPVGWVVAGAALLSFLFVGTILFFVLTGL